MNNSFASFSSDIFGSSGCRASTITSVSEFPSRHEFSSEEFEKENISDKSGGLCPTGSEVTPSQKQVLPDEMKKDLKDEIVFAVPALPKRPVRRRSSSFNNFETKKKEDILERCSCMFCVLGFYTICDAFEIHIFFSVIEGKTGLSK